MHLWVDVAPNGSCLSCGRLASRRKSSGRQSAPGQGHNTPFPLKRSPPASFKRLLGSEKTLLKCHEEPIGHDLRGADSIAELKIPASSNMRIGVVL